MAFAQGSFNLRRGLTWALPAAVTIIWVVLVATTDMWDRVTEHWEAAVTMVFGSFVAGATPQGGGAVAFPVFTKVLGVSAPVARTFSLSIQAVGMGVASLIILIARRPIVSKAVWLGGGAGIAGFLVGLFVLSDPSTVFWESFIPGPYVKVTFTLVLAAMSYVVLLTMRSEDRGSSDIPGNRRVMIGLLLAGFLGGIASALTGSGVDVAVFLFAVTMCGLHPRVGVPTSIVAMAMVSMFGLLVLGVLGGQLATTLGPNGSVVSVGGTAVPNLPSSQFDIYGLWLASLPIVVWGAPLGTWVAHVLHETGLIILVGLMAAVEVVSTVIFLGALYSDPVLMAYAVIGLVVSIGGVTWLVRQRAYFSEDPVPAGIP